MNAGTLQPKYRPQFTPTSDTIENNDTIVDSDSKTFELKETVVEQSSKKS